VKYFGSYYQFFVLFIALLLTLTIDAQQFADKSYYLIDSLVLEDLSERDRHSIDSALNIYYNTDNDTDRINAIYIILEENRDVYSWLKYNEWIYLYAEKRIEELSLSIEEKRDHMGILKLRHYQAESLYYIGYHYSSQSEMPIAFEYYFNSLEIFKKIGEQKGTAKVLNNIAYAYKFLGDFQKSLEIYHQSLKIREEIRDSMGIASTLNNIGMMHRDQGEIPVALEYFEKSLKIKEDINDQIGITVSLTNIGSIYRKQKEFDVALDYYKRSLKMSEEIGFKSGISSSLINLGHLYQNQDENQKALEAYHKCLIMKQDLGDKEGLSNTLYSIGKVNYNINELYKAKEFGEKSMVIAQEIGSPSRIKNAADLLSKVYKKEGSWKKAFQMQELFLTMKDSIRNEETEKDAIRQQANYEINKKEQKIALLSSQNQVLEKDKEVQTLKLNRNRILAISFSTGFGMVLILAIVIYKGYQRKQKINEILEKQNDEKTAMMKEIHHRVKNNLQVVNSLLRLQSYEIEDEKVVTMFEECQNRVLSMALLHEKMYRSDDLQHIDIHEHFTLLVKDLVSNYAVGKEIELDIEVEEVDIGIKTLVPLGLIINEIITNSLKYAFKDQKKGTIKVYLKHLEGIRNEMIIGDDGVGMEKDFKVEESSSLGTELVQIFTEQLEGKMERLDVPGTLFRFEFEKIDKE